MKLKTFVHFALFCLFYATVYAESGVLDIFEWDYFHNKQYDSSQVSRGFEDGCNQETKAESYHELTKIDFDENLLATKLVSSHVDYNHKFRFGDKGAIYFKDGGTFKIAFSNENGMFNDVYSVDGGIPMRSAAVVTIGTEIFMAAGVEERILHKIKDPCVTKRIQVKTSNFVKITFSGTGASMIRLASLPATPVYISLFEIDGKIHAFMTDEKGKGRIIVYNNHFDSWEELSVFDMNQWRLK